MGCPVCFILRKKPTAANENNTVGSQVSQDLRGVVFKSRERSQLSLPYQGEFVVPVRLIVLPLREPFAHFVKLSVPAGRISPPPRHVAKLLMAWEA